MVGRLEIQRNRAAAETAVGNAFEIRAFNGAVVAWQHRRFALITYMVGATA